MKRCLLLCCLAFSTQVHGATLQVPSRIRFANIRLELTQDAKKRVQEKVDSLTRSDKYFQVLLDRANLFMPIVERILKEEKLPIDFKYLAILESELISDIVSSANAVGFWQFKEPAAREVGLKIDRHVDERMHIAAATRGAARYLKQHNQAFDNWLYAMLAYYEGQSGAKKFIMQHYLGAKAMKIDRQAHAYLIHFLAYKVAFEKILGRDRHPELYLHEYQEVHGKTLTEIAEVFSVNKTQIKAYNKWLKRDRVPKHATCAAIIPMTHRQYARQVVSVTKGISEQNNIDYTRYQEESAKFPVIAIQQQKKSNTGVTKINNIVGVVASAGASLISLAQTGGISLAQFLTFNDLNKEHKVISGQVYYYQTKRRKAGVHFHITQAGDTWWSVSQKYGIKKNELLLKNRLRKEMPLQSGRVLWLRFIRPAKIPVAYAHSSDVAR